MSGLARTLQQKPWLTVAIILVAMATTGVGGYFLGVHQAKPRPTLPAEQAPPANRLGQSLQRLPERAFGNWRLQCVKNAQGAKHCELVLRGVAKDSKKLLAALLIGKGPRGRTVLSILTPPGVILPKGVLLKLGDTDAGSIPFLACTPRFCEAGRSLDDKTAGMLDTAETAGVRYTLASGRMIGFKLSTTGFAQGYAAWQAEGPQGQRAPLAPDAATPK